MYFSMVLQECKSLAKAIMSLKALTSGLDFSLDSFTAQVKF